MATIDKLIDSIAATLHQVNAYELPAVCVQLGLDDGEGSEAMRSKRLYVRGRLTNKPKDFVIEVAQRTIEEYPSIGLSNILADFIADQFKVSPTTRRNLIEELILIEQTGGEPLSGRLNVVDFLKRIWPLNRMPSTDYRYTTAEGDIYQHMVNNQDWDYYYLFDTYLGLLKGKDSQFLQFSEELVHPSVRNAETQAEYVARINRHLIQDHYCLKPSGQIAALPLYKIQKTQEGVPERVKNLIFAADGPKPEIVFTDSVSNDIKITANEKYCLIYERTIPATGLLWTDLAAWWRETREQDKSIEDAQRNLYSRLLKSLASEPEKLLFDAYYRTLKDKYKTSLPALIPQVYLHYDPYTIKQLNGDQRLVRQRMDFLILFSEHHRVIIEVDGKQHYSTNDRADPKKYAEMVSEDRRLQIAGYEIYRFGGYELHGETGKTLVETFFRQLFQKHRVKS
jgi:very-short-patch-repair endonuclease